LSPHGPPPSSLSSSEVSLLRVELFLADVTPDIALPEDLERRI
jgi:hypothetical protein